MTSDSFGTGTSDNRIFLWNFVAEHAIMTVGYQGKKVQSSDALSFLAFFCDLNQKKEKRRR